MQTKTYIPKPPLSYFITSFWICRRRAEPSLELALPTGTVELVINLGQSRLRVFGQNARGGDSGFESGVVCGPHSEAFVIDSAADEEIIAVNFKPGGVAPFLDMPSDHLQNCRVSIDVVWGRRGQQLREELVHAGSDHDRFQILESFLLRQAPRPLFLDPRVTHSLKLLQSGADSLSIVRLSDQVGVSQRRLIELFRTTTGLSPKQYMRIRRLQKVIVSITCLSCSPFAKTG